MNKNLKEAFYSFAVIGLVLSILYWYAIEYLPVPTPTPTPRSEDTVTPTSTNTIFRAHIDMDTLCLSGTSEDSVVVTTIPQDRYVMLIGKDSDQPEWLLVRWGAFQDCWVEKRFVTSSDIDFLEIVATPPESTFTPNSTFTFIPTETSTPTKTRVGATATLTRKPPINSNTSIAPLTNTPKPSTKTQDPTNTSKPSTNTPKPPTDTPKPPTDTPKPPSNTPKPPTNTPCPTNPGGHVPPGHCP